MSIMGLIALLMMIIIMGAPIFIAILASCMVYLLVNGQIPIEIMVQQTYSGIDKYSLLAIPLFIFSGNIITQSCIGEKIMLFVQQAFGRFVGGLSLSTVLSSIFFSMISGSAPATVLTVGRLSTPPMLASGYSRKFTLGLILSTGSLGIVIPPSIFLIVFGVVTGTSVAELFKYGAIAGLLFGGVFVIGAIVYTKLNGFAVEEKASAIELWTQFKKSFLCLVLPAFVIVGISTGLTSPTEVGVVILLYGSCLGLFVYRDLTWASIVDVAYQSAKTSAQIMVIMAAASLLGWLIAESNVLVAIGEWFNGLDSLLLSILLLNIFFLVAGMLIDITSLSIILSGVIIAISQSLEISTITIGIIMAITGAIGMCTPPFGLSLFVAPEIGSDSYSYTLEAMKPFYIICLIGLILINVTFLVMDSLFLTM